MNFATIGLLTYGINALWLLFALIALILLVQLYTRTRMSGFLWLVFALVVWPFLSRAGSMVLPIYYARQALPAQSLMLTTLSVTAVETVIGGVLLLIALVVLQRELAQRNYAERMVAPGVRGF
jgi:hypothetical protein